jgi:hypothetical protein
MQVECSDTGLAVVRVRHFLRTYYTGGFVLLDEHCMCLLGFSEREWICLELVKLYEQPGTKFVARIIISDKSWAPHETRSVFESSVSKREFLCLKKLRMWLRQKRYIYCLFWYLWIMLVDFLCKWFNEFTHRIMLALKMLEDCIPSMTKYECGSRLTLIFSKICLHQNNKALCSGWWKHCTHFLTCDQVSCMYVHQRQYKMASDPLHSECTTEMCHQISRERESETSWNFTQANCIV